MSIVLGIVGLLGVIFMKRIPLEGSEPLLPPDEEPDKLNFIGEKFPEFGEDFGYRDLLSTIDFYILWFVFGGCAGCGFVIFNNLGAFYLSLGGTEFENYVIILSVFNCSGRFITGFISDKFSISRPNYLIIACSLMTFSMIWFSFTNTTFFFVGIVVVGVAYGMLMTSTPSFVSDYYGKKKFGGNWSFTRAAPGVTSFVLATILAASLYENAIETEGEKNCYGRNCFQPTFLILSFFGCCLIFLAWTLTKRANYYLYNKRGITKDDAPH